MKCVDEWGQGVILIMKGVDLLAVDVLVHTHVHALRAPEAVLDPGHTLLPPEGVMTTLPPHRGQRKESTGGHRSSIKSTMAIRSVDPIHLRIGMTAVVQTMVMMRGRGPQAQQQRTMRSLVVGAAGHPGRRLCRPQGHGRGRRHQPVAADVKRLAATR